VAGVIPVERLLFEFNAVCCLRTCHSMFRFSTCPYNRTALSSGRKRFVFKVIPGSNLCAETDYPDWFSACFNGSAGESLDDISNQSIIGSFHVLSLSLFINHKDTTLKTWA
jgi:hypothetical protein